MGLPVLTHDRSTLDEGAADADIAGPSPDTGGGISSAAEPAGAASDAGTGPDGADGAVNVDAADAHRDKTALRVAKIIFFDF